MFFPIKINHLFIKIELKQKYKLIHFINEMKNYKYGMNN